MLTILIPSYNHEAYIIECLQEAVKVKVRGLKILVIDDGSTDQTARLVQEYIDENENNYNIQLIEKENSGLISSLNMGLEMADTKYFYLVASDDILDPAGIEECIRTLETEEGANFVIGGAQYFGGLDSSGDVYGDEHQIFFNESSKVRRNKLFLDYPHPVLLQSSVFRAAALHEIGGWNTEVTIDDYQIFIKFLSLDMKVGKEFLYKPDVNCVYYRIHDSNSYKDTVRQHDMIEEVFEAYCPEEFKPKALAKSSAYHFLISIRKGDFQAGLEIIKKLKIKYLGWFIYYIVNLVYKRLIK